MKRDLDLCRRILLHIEANPEATGANTIVLGIKDHDPAEVDYHVRLLESGGLIAADQSQRPVNNEQFYAPRCLTWAGHEFIATLGKDNIWERVKTTVLEKTGGLSFDVLKAFAIKIATDAVFKG